MHLLFRGAVCCYDRGSGCCCDSTWKGAPNSLEGQGGFLEEEVIPNLSAEMSEH